MNLPGWEARRFQNVPPCATPWEMAVWWLRRPYLVVPLMVRVVKRELRLK